MTMTWSASSRHTLWGRTQCSLWLWARARDEVGNHVHTHAAAVLLLHTATPTCPSENRHLHITPETLTWRSKGLANLAGNRVDIGNTHGCHLSAELKNSAQ